MWKKIYINKFVQNVFIEIFSRNCLFNINEIYIQQIYCTSDKYIFDFSRFSVEFLPLKNKSMLTTIVIISYTVHVIFF